MGAARWRLELVHDLQGEATALYCGRASRPDFRRLLYTAWTPKKCCKAILRLAELIRLQYQPVKNFYDFEIYPLEIEHGQRHQS